MREEEEDGSELINLDKPINRRISRLNDPPDARAMWGVLHEQAAKLKAVDRDLAEMKKAIADLTISSAVLSEAVKSIDQKLDLKLQEQFLSHEKREGEMQNRVMARMLLLMLSAMGAMAYFILTKVSMAMGTS